MGKRRAAKQVETKPTAGTVLSDNRQQHNEKLLAAWTQREIEMKLQCSADDAQMAAASVLSMSPKQLREWCTNLLSECEKRLDEDRRFYNVFMDKKEEFGLLNADAAPAAKKDDDLISETGSTSTSATASSFKGKRAKYNKQVDISKTKDGLEALLPVSQECNCEARKHKLLTNCQLCGKIVCEQEGWGRCYFCGAELRKDNKPISTKQQDETGTPHPHPPITNEKCFFQQNIKPKQQRESFFFLTPPNLLPPITTDEDYLQREREFLKAMQRRDVLIQFQDDREKRTTIVDDQEDYYSSNNPWLDRDERKKAESIEQREKDDRIARHKKGGSYVAHIDIFNKNVEMVTEKDMQIQRAELKRTDEELLKSSHENQPSSNTGSTFEQRQRDGTADDDDEASGNINVTHNAVYSDNIGTELEEIQEEDTEGNTITSLRVTKCPDIAKTMTYDTSAMLQVWIAEKLTTDYDISEYDAAKDASNLARMTNMSAVRMWAKTHLDAKGITNNFAEEYELASHHAQMSQVREERSESRPDASQKYANPSGTGRIQTDWDAEEEEDVPAQPKRKAWVTINSPIAAKLDRKLRLQGGATAMCMSMHQPWASLLVCGIKKHEGRTWNTEFRGRLFIHAASKQPTDDDIASIEGFYADRGHKTFPTHYPTSVLLGCVTVTDCLHYEEYKTKIPAKDQESSSEFVFVCHNPQMLVCPFESLL